MSPIYGMTINMSKEIFETPYVSYLMSMPFRDRADHIEFCMKRRGSVAIELMKETGFTTGIDIASALDQHFLGKVYNHETQTD